MNRLVVYAGALVLMGLVGACGSDEEKGNGDAAADASPEGYDGSYEGRAHGGVAMSPPPVDAAIGTGEIPINHPCCEVTLAIADDGSGRSGGRVRGNFPPLDGEAGLALSLAAGQWSATACLPSDFAVEYHFELDPPPGVAGTEDGGTMDGGTMDGGATDAGAPQTRFVLESQPRILDDEGLAVNILFIPADCGAPANP